MQSRFWRTDQNEHQQKRILLHKCETFAGVSDWRNQLCSHGGIYELVFDLISMQDATESSLCPELVGEQLRLEQDFTIPLEHVTELIVLGERMSLLAVDKLGVVGKAN